MEIKRTKKMYLNELFKCLSQSLHKVCPVCVSPLKFQKAVFFSKSDIKIQNFPNFQKTSVHV